MDIHELRQFESVYEPSKEVAFCWLRKKYVQLSTEEDHTEIVDHANDSLRIWKAAKAQAVPEWISVEGELPPVDETVLVCWDYAADIEPDKEYLTIDEDYNEYWPNCQDEPPTHWMPLPRVIVAQEPK